MEANQRLLAARSREEAREVARRRADEFELHSGIPARTAAGKTVCRQFFQKAVCAFGGQCKFAHVKEDEREVLLQELRAKRQQLQQQQQEQQQ